MSLVFNVHYLNGHVQRAVGYMNLWKEKIKIRDIDMEIMAYR